MARPNARDPGEKPFILPPEDQLGVPLTPRGTVPDGGHLSATEKLLMLALRKFDRQGGPIRASNVQLAEAIGMRGSRQNQITYVAKLLNGRKDKGQHRPGLVERGWLEVRPDDNPANPTRRLIRGTAKWTEYVRTRLRVVGTDGPGPGRDEAIEAAGPTPAAQADPPPDGQARISSESEG